MKKIIITIVSLFAGLSAMADVVSSSEALSVAKKFMNASSATLVLSSSEVSTKADSTPSFYVFNISGGGWVIVSGEDCTTPILGYSDKGSFNPSYMPVNLVGWLGSIDEEIRQARADRLEATQEVKARWANPVRSMTKAGAGSKYFETAFWDQSSPYNDLLSTYVKRNGSGVNNLLTGCVATAMAIVLKYYEWPVKGTGTIGGYTSNGYNVDSYELGEEYDWANMTMKYSSSSTTEEKNAVARLMVDCGVMVEMAYSTSGSGAYSEDIVPALTSHMGYSKNASLKYRSNYTIGKWFEMIKEEIDKNQPILYSGSGSDGGHQFVCQGYDPENVMVYINWGWSGGSNGYFAFNLSIPRSYTFDEGQSAIFGLVPDKDGTSEYEAPEIEIIGYPYGSTPDGIVLLDGKVAKGETFRLVAGKFYNNSERDYTGAFKVVLVDKDGKWKEDLSEPIEMADEEDPEGLPGGYLCWFEEDDPVECTINGDLSMGDRIAFWYSLNDGSWAPMAFSKEDLSYPWEWAVADACFIRTAKSYKAGDQFYYSLIPGNKGINSVAWTFDGKSATGFSTSLTSGTHTVVATVTFTDNTTEKITQKIVVK